MMVSQLQEFGSLGLGGLLVALVGYSIWRLINAWVLIAQTEKATAVENKARAEVLQKKLTEETAFRVSLEVEVKYLKLRLEEALARISELERQL